MSLRHLTDSIQLLTLINYFGHCQSYSQILKLETTMCNSIVVRWSVLPSTITWQCIYPVKIVDNKETHAGARTTHTAHRIVILYITETDDLLRAEQVGQNAFSKVNTESLVDKNVSFHSP